MNVPSPTPSSTGNGTTTTGPAATKVTMDAIDKRIMGLRARLTPDPYCDPAFREEYVTYLSPGSSATVPRSGGLSGLEDSVSDAVSSSGRAGHEDYEEYYPISDTDPEPHISSQTLDGQEASNANATQRKVQKYTPLRESVSKHGGQEDWDTARVRRDTKPGRSRDGDLGFRDNHSDGDEDSDSILKGNDRYRYHDRDQARARDSQRNGITDTDRDRDRVRAKEHDSHSIDRHKELGKVDDRNRIHERQRAHENARSTGKVLDRTDSGRTRDSQGHGHNGSAIPPSPPNEKSDKTKTKTKKEKPLSREAITYYPLTPLPSLLSPTIPSVFDSDGADIVNTLGMITPTLPPYFESDLSGLGIRFEDDRNSKHRKTPSDTLLQSHGTSTIDKARSRIVVLRIPSFTAELTTHTKRDLSENLKEGTKRRKVENAIASRLHQTSSTARSTTPQLSRESALSTSSGSYKLSSKAITAAAASTASRSPTVASTTPSLSPHPVLSSKEKVVSSIQTTSPSDHQAATPPSQVAAANDAASTPGTPSAKKSTFAEYNKRRLIGGGDAPVSPASHQNEFANDKTFLSNAHKLSSTESSHSTLPRTSSNGSVSLNSQAVQVLERKAQKWIAIATGRKHESDRQREAGNMPLASLYAMDSLLAYLVGFDYDDKFFSIKSRVPSDKNWSTLVPFTRHLVTLHESSKAPLLAGLSYQIRAVVYLRMAGYQRQTVKALQHSSVPESRESGTMESPEPTASGSSTTNNHVAEVTELLTKASRNMDLAAYDFQRGARMFPIEAVIERCPNTWRRRALAAEHLSQSMPAIMGGGSSGPGLRPLEDQFVLPIQMYSSVREVAAFGASVLGEWAEQNKLKYESVLAKGVLEQ
ncbi:hypothetical protein V1523DRAFT_420198 [Lipomyces doorenjongii]